MPEQARHFFSQITGSATQMSELVDALLEFSRMGRVELRPGKKWTCRPWSKPSSRNSPRKPGTARSSGSGEPAESAGGCGPAAPGVCHLLANAIKYTRPRQPARIEIGVLAGLARETVIFVRDNGVGFDMAGVDKLFGVFQRLHCARSSRARAWVSRMSAASSRSWRHKTLGGQRNRRWALFTSRSPHLSKKAPNETTHHNHRTPRGLLMEAEGFQPAPPNTHDTRTFQPGAGQAEPAHFCISRMTHATAR